MTYEKMGARFIDYMPWRCPGSRLVFRGPRRRLEGDYIAFLGGTDTFGKFIRNPFPMLLEDRLGIACVNLGWPNAGVDVFLNEPAIIGVCQRATVVVLQLPCAQNMSNRFYAVHPRRNDRFIGPSDLMRSIFPEVDFTEFHFTRHMLQRIRQVAPDRFSLLQDELQSLWMCRMQFLLDQIGVDAILLWFSSCQPGGDKKGEDLFTEPGFVSDQMIRMLADQAGVLVKVRASRDTCQSGSTGMVLSDLEAAAAAELLDPVAHEAVAEALFPVLRQRLS